MIMSGFKGSLESEWLFGQEARLFGNFMRNWEGEVEDADFFVLFGDEGAEDAKLALGMLSKHYSREELEECDVVGWRGRGPEEEGRLVLRNSVRGALREVWNGFGKAGRGRCKAMLEEWLGEVLRRRGGGRRGKRDALARRVGEVCKVLSLDGTERDLLVYAAVREMTEFDDFP